MSRSRTEEPNAGLHHILRGFTAIASVAALLQGRFAPLKAQGVTTAAIHGVVRAAEGHTVEGARVTIRNASTGFVVHTEVRHGRFVAEGLEVGGPYSVSVTWLGLRPERRDGIVLALGESRDLYLLMQPAVSELDTVRANASATPATRDREGAGTTILTDPLLHDLPTLNRNIYDFVELSPEVSTKIGFAPGGISGAGSGFRFNEFLLNGVSQRSVGGQVPPEFSGAESVPFDAVREYRIVLTPFDVRYGDFVGALIDAVTRSGTNHFEGSVFSYWRSDGLAGRGSDSVIASYNRLQYGLSFGGPILRDRLHFFVATDAQRFTSPAPGPYVGQPASSLQPVPVSEADVARLDQIFRGYGLTAGSAGAVENRNPLGSLYTRLDLALPEVSSRAIFWVNETRARSFNFSRVSTTGFFPLTSFAATQASDIQSAALHLDTDLPAANGSHNELLISSYRAGNASRTNIRQPIVFVSVPGTTGGSVLLETGTPTQAQGSSLDGHSIEVRDDVTLPLGASHVVTIGAVAEIFRTNRHGLPDPYGMWRFQSLDSLVKGTALSFTVDQDLGSANAGLGGEQYALYVGDMWQRGERFTLTAGIRADLLALADHAPFNATIDSIFGRRTGEMPRQRPELSPRLGFKWKPFASARDQLRGGVGMFTARPPVAWLHAPVYSYGLGIGTLNCGPQMLGPAPPFAPDHQTPPLSCANGASLANAPRGNVDLLDPNLRMARSLRGAVDYDRQLPWNLAASTEVLVTRGLSDFAFVNLNLVGPQAQDRNGRVMYGTIVPGAGASPVLRSSFPEVIDLQNVSRNHAVQLSARLERQWGEAVTAMASYTFSRVRDAQTPLRVNTAKPGTDNWASRALSGREDDLSPGISLNDIPHRVVFAGTRRASWHGWPTVISAYYVGESGSPFSYMAYGGNPALGDLNADGSNTNDPIYVPKSALDTNEIRFAQYTRQLNGRTDTVTAGQQGQALERFIEGSSCLRRQRGRIVTRNSCREPWSNTLVASLRQGIPLGSRSAEMQFDVYNLLNLLDRAWGQYRVANPSLLQQVNETAGPPTTSHPIFNFSTTRTQWNTLPAQSAFQLQLALRYRF